MHLFYDFLILATVGFLTEAAIVLKRGVNKTVVFEGEELIFELNNPKGVKAYIEICLGSTADSVSIYCPQGYAPVISYVQGEKQLTVKFNRNGQFFEPGSATITIDNVIFGPDGSLNVLLPDFPSTMTAVLPNAEIPVVTTTTTTTALTPHKETSNKAMTGIICVVVVLILVITIIIVVSLYCWYNRRRRQPVSATMPEEDAHQTRQGLEEPFRKVVIKSTTPKPTRATPSAVITTTTTKPPSTSTTKTSNEKPQVAVVQKPASTITVMRQTEEPNCVSIIPASAYGQRSTVLPRSSQFRSKSSMKEVVSIDGSQNL
uniref:Uncharacterized protein n=1 Tax=Panagrellus redivivus TaxID=6233 RepID=A0A7E4V2R8_PANRE